MPPTQSLSRVLRKALPCRSLTVLIQPSKCPKVKNLKATNLKEKSLKARNLKEKNLKAKSLKAKSLKEKSLKVKRKIRNPQETKTKPKSS